MGKFTMEGIRNMVRQRYGKRAVGEITGCGVDGPSACCTSSGNSDDQLSMNLGYSREDVEQVPEGANMGLGCGNPQTIAQLKEGETVLDLGSGGGFDCFLASPAVGPKGQVIGVDMTPEMLTKARENAAKGGYANVEFRLGEIENLPLADSIVDIIMSNCVINLSPEKNRVYAEAYRVLKPGGRIAISDVLALQELPERYRQDIELLGACVGGAETVKNTKKMLEELGFESVIIDIAQKSRDFIEEYYPGSELASYVASAAIQAEKPADVERL